MPCDKLSLRGFIHIRKLPLEVYGYPGFSIAERSVLVPAAEVITVFFDLFAGIDLMQQFPGVAVRKFAVSAGNNIVCYAMGVVVVAERTIKYKGVYGPAVQFFR
jgi:hypothetical protein